jgi:hypothetical protein
MPVVLAGLWALPGAMSLAQETGGEKRIEPPPPVTPPAAAPVESCAPHRSQCVPGLKIVEENCAITIPGLEIRPILSRQKVPDLAITYREEKKTVLATVLKPREVEEAIPCMTVEHETIVDPCTGKCCTVEKQVPGVKIIKTTVFDTVTEERVVIIRVPEIKPVEREVLVKTLAAFPTAVPAVEKRLRAIPTNGEVTVPTAPCPPPPCLPH